MKTEIKKISDSKIEIFFELPWPEFSPYLDKAAQNLSENLALKGFRPGKIPREFVEKEIGEGKVLAEGAEVAIKEKYPQVVREKNLEVIGSPQVEILKLAQGNPFSFRIKIEVLPEIELPDYKKIAAGIERKEVSVEEKEVNQTLEWLQKSRAKFHNLERKSKRGDFLEIEYSSPQIENGKVYQDRFFLGKGQFVPGFEENLEGMKKEEEKEFQLSLPSNYFKKELAGKKVNFKVKIKKVQQVEFPEINDDFARSLGKFNDLKELRNSIKQGITKEKEIAERERRRKEILEKIAQESKFEVPEVLISLERDRIFEDLKQNVKNQLKTSFEEYLQKIKKSAEELKSSLKSEAEKRARNFLILREIGKREGVKVNEGEVIEALNQLLKNYPSLEKAGKEIDLERLKEYYRGVIYNEKVFQLLENL